MIIFFWGKTIAFFKDTFRTIFSKLTLSIWVIATLGAVLAGPFGTFDTMPIGVRSLYWSLVTTSSIVLGYLAHAISRMIFGLQETLKSQITAGVFGTVFIATAVFLLSNLIFSSGGAAVSFFNLLGWVGFVFFAVILCRTMFLKAISAEISTKIKAETPLDVKPIEIASQKKPRILERLPNTDHGLILRLSANDHFVQVVTETGEHAVRMRLRDAISEMDGIEGSLLHRSHWVAHDAISNKDHAQGKVQIVLKNGDRIPVSRNYRGVIDRLNVPLTQCAAEERSSVSAQ